MALSLSDFTETIEKIDKMPLVKRVIAAWGESGDFNEWCGGFLCEVFGDKPFVYISGWCDSTGWGCQDGVHMLSYDSCPDLQSLQDKVEWELDPVDLNQYVVRLTTLDKI